MMFDIMNAMHYTIQYYYSTQNYVTSVKIKMVFFQVKYKLVTFSDSTWK